MKKLNRTACNILNYLTQGLDKPGDHMKKDESPGAFMAVHVEHIGSCNLGPKFSVAHYYEQNSDLMKDPDMVFIRGKDGEYYPIEFQQDNIAFFQRAVSYDDDEKIDRYHPLIQADMVKFANQWMVNIAMQQHINCKRKLRK